ncbi:uncharacterized protein BDW43DRAFT_304052 [Aspergillus alliaceus]|uniref:uncharacterized protein n=1 Tax=Petromyces alliaceus TaxID=209559 RepID=UPI0012A4F36F|nr:uncharacterized protein BDW43DRAFT_304052 [Aspergillus alliaceus]KAB8228235.1 hypothetical protein BDW43DRAFT_304052 [Aspergillus alliaceus]
MQIQFATHHTGQPKIVKMPILSKSDNDTAQRAWHRAYKCGSVKICSEHAPHMNLNSLRELSGAVLNNKVDDLLKAATEEFFRGFLNTWKQRGCIYKGYNTCHSDLPVMFHRNCFLFIGCSKNSDLEPWHYAYAIECFQQIDRSYLKSLVKYGFKEPKQECDFISQVTTGKQFCDRSHPGNPGHLIKPKCRFMLSPIFTNLYDRFGPSTLRTLHKCLNIEDRITALIRKQKLLSFPEGTHIAGILREYSFDRLKENSEQWIREVHFFDPEHWLIICCTYAQAKAFIHANYLEMDLFFKMVNGKTNVFSISSWNAQTKRINTYAYAFLNLETRHAYAVMFSKIFKILGDVARSPVHFAHISPGEENEIRTITVDMCRKQAGGRFNIS